MKNLNIFNLEQIIFSNQQVLKYLRENKIDIYNNWKQAIFINNKSQKMQFYLEFLNFLNDDKLKFDLENLIGYEIAIDNIDVSLVKNYDISIDLFDDSLKSKCLENYKSIVICRDDKNINVTAWR